MGDIEKIRYKKGRFYCENGRFRSKRIDLVIGGSPCQGFSIAGKQLNFKDPRSKLFFEYVRLLEEIRVDNPNVLFVLENVWMKEQYQKIISDYLGVYPCELNSNLVSAQNRKRLFWSNINTRSDNLFGELYTYFPGLADSGILLKDILQPESEVDEKHYIKNPKFGFKGLDKNCKSRSLRVSGKQSQSRKNNYDLISVADDDTIGVVNNFGVLSAREKANCIDHNYFKGLDNKGGRTYVASQIGAAKYDRTEEGKSVRSVGQRRGKGDSTPFSKKTIIGIKYDKMGTITSAKSKENLVIQLNVSNESGGVQPYQQNRVYSPEGLSPCLGTDKRSAIVPVDVRLRRLTVIECSRLQTIPDYYKWYCSDSQALKMLGNGWTLKIITHIFSFIK